MSRRSEHALSVEGAWGYCRCGWSTGPRHSEADVEDDFEAHLDHRCGRSEIDPDDDLAFEDDGSQTFTIETYREKHA